MKPALDLALLSVCDSLVTHPQFFPHSLFLCSVSELDNPEARVQEIHSIVHRLPEKNRQMLELLMKHLAK